MFARLATFAIQQRVFVLLITFALTVFGLRAWLELPIEAFPDVQDVQVQVVTQFPGQSPEEVERSISLPIEREMSGVPRATQIRSVSMTGLSVVTLVFSDGTEDRFARSQVLEKLQTVDLPPGVQPQLGPLATAVGEVFRYVVDAPPDMPMAEVRALQDWVVRPTLRRVPGIADIVSFGGTVKQFQVSVDPARLGRYGVTLDQISAALSSDNANASGGVLRRGEENLLVRSIGLFRSLDDIRAVVVSADQGRTVTVGDLATVTTGEALPAGVVAYDDRDSVVQGIVVMTKGENAVKVVEALKERVDRLNTEGQLPAGVKIRSIYERTDLINHTVHTVAENLAVGAALVVAVLIVFLRNWRAALIVASIIPLTLLFAFILMDARGISANLISLGAVDFGIIIDSAVVMVEALMVRLAVHANDVSAREHPVSFRLHALRNTVTSLAKPILFSKAIIILAFLPIFTFQRVEGKIFSPVAYTLSFSLLGAILLTLTLVPTLLAGVLMKRDMAEVHLHWMEALQNRYRALLGMLRTRLAALLLASVGTLCASLALVPWLGSEFLPKLDEGNIWLTVSLAPATALAQTKEVERDIRALLRQYPEVKSVLTQVGRPDEGTDPKGPNNIEVLADLQPHEQWRFAGKEALVADMTAKLRAIPGLPTNFSQVIQDNVEETLSGVKGEVAVKIYGPNLDILQDKADQVAAILGRIRGSTDVAAIKTGGQTEILVTPDRARLARYGLRVGDVSGVVQTAFGGHAVGQFYEGERVFDVVVRLDKAHRDAVEDLGRLQVSLPAGGVLPLSELADIEIRQGASRIQREAGGRTVAVKANLIGRDQGSFVAEAMGVVEREVKLPAGYRMTWGGQFENQQRAMKRLAVIVPVSLLAIFSLLFWAFRSMRVAALIMALVPFTLVGGLVGLWLAGLHLSVSAAVGFIAVAGISVQNGVIMVEQIVELLNNGKSALEAVTEGAVARLRPILMTALMAGLGLLPAALSHAIGSETQRPFAVVIVGGVISATLFTLLLLPTLYARFAVPPPRYDAGPTKDGHRNATAAGRG
ncbi:Cation efflux system protein czcA [Methyloversatilis universalis FAM5]|uniref:Cation efflux system protein czcA n=1 Tax=Methyloversatilis universalis (strain ATCC BAA-1314 / DSM 25237 / JCM 13912 / CCUG 52030 / FAM5) TaxID=1000565 RepID=F5R7Z5_METUF|nr:CusA/CzcA family heavy metal efflux RND transporter [Methyloversatilis universalis]EGK73173.1 Cation efflux system protein czcA [Methyloversatilis universalis FAM5]